MQGMAEGSGTSSSLLWEVRRLLNECDELPQVLLMENVPQVHSKTNMPHFQKWIDFLTEKGYQSFWKDLNAKDYGIPQNRKRTFVVSILGDYTYKFPEPVELKIYADDLLETVVDESYKVKGERMEKLLDTLISKSKTITDRQTDRQTDRRVIDLSLKNPSFRNIANCITAGCRGISNHQQEQNGVLETYCDV